MGNYHSTRPPVEGCPQPETPIRERAWTDAQKGPTIVCCVCGEPCSIYSPVCAKCAAAIGDTP